MSLSRVRVRIREATQGPGGGFVSVAVMSWRTPHQKFHFLRAGCGRTFTMPYEMLCTRRHGSVAKNRIRRLLLLQRMSKQLSALRATHRQRNFIRDFVSRPKRALRKMQTGAISRRFAIHKHVLILGSTRRYTEFGYKIWRRKIYFWNMRIMLKFTSINLLGWDSSYLWICID
jgi:hypothetical protein